MEQFFVTNLSIVASVSGQTFFVVGLLAALGFRRYSRLPLARPLWMLAAFGLFYALAEWGLLFIPIQERYLPEPVTETLWLLRALLLAAAFGALLQFGIELLPPRSRTRLRAAPPVLFAVWIGLSIGGGGTVWDLGAAITIAELQARLILALPAGLVCAAGLFLQERYLKSLGGEHLARWLRLTALAAALVSLTLGLMLPSVGVWPGSEWFLGMPAQVWRGAAGLLFALGLTRILAVFQLEQDRVVEAAERRVIAAHARERLAHELSDGVIQRLYAVGLLLSAAAQRTPVDDPLHTALEELDGSIQSLRESIVRAEADAQAELTEDLLPLAEPADSRPDPSSRLSAHPA
ncbi:MAG: histidine kinase dimerization/phosphoacceptor domain-containing protein [Chloroflexi bacterium]|nr:histidine kinase dimerization/phosphoacceptor domain-containing protein [Chloroflexota bacterium]